MQYRLSSSHIAMDGPVKYLDLGSEVPCTRCKTERAVLLSRKEHFCSKCFVWFMRGKQRKLMMDERFKVRYGQADDRTPKQKVLLPWSYGVSSTVLIDMVALMLQEQNQTHNGKQGFELVVLHLSSDDLKIPEVVSLLQKYHPVKIEFRTVDVDTYSQRPQETILVESDFRVSAAPGEQKPVSEMLRGSTRAVSHDLMAIIHKELILDFALQEGCQAIIYGHSLTRLATEVISLTVLGRGSAISSEIHDRTVTHKGTDIQVIYPLRDIFQAEVVAVLKLRDLQEFVTSHELEVQNAKTATVQDLTARYFRHLDATGYASTASTVTRTAEKLSTPKEPEVGNCRICLSPVYHVPQTWLKNITVSLAAPLTSTEEEEFAKLKPAVAERASGESALLCYGCTVTVSSVDSINWPSRSMEQETLDEFVISEDDEEGDETDET